jgi:hypothetical protein
MTRGISKLVACGAMIGAVLAAACSSGDIASAPESSAAQAVVAPSQYAVTVYRESDRCEGDADAVMEPTSKCASLSATEPARSVKVRGQCLAIASRSVRWACMRYKQGSTVVFGDGVCSDDNLIANISPGDDCWSLSDSVSAGGVISTGACLGCDQCTTWGTGGLQSLCLAVLWGGGP